jgi:hypothetical protein
VTSLPFHGVEIRCQAKREQDESTELCPVIASAPDRPIDILEQAAGLDRVESFERISPVLSCEEE